MSNPTGGDRRQNPDRRNPRSRRRHADARSVYVELCRSVLRVAIVVDEGDDEPPRLRTRTVHWRREASGLMSDLGRAELAAALGQLVAEERLAGCGVSLAINGTLCVTRAASGATAKVEQEITDLRERSQLYLSLGPGPKTSAVGRKHIDARHEHALVTITNQRTLDLLVQAAQSAGLVVQAVESALVAISRLQGRIEPDETDAVLLAQVDERRFELGVSRGGQLLLEYRPAAETTVDHLGKVIDSHRDRLKRFCGRQYGVGRTNLDRLWLVGDPDEIDSLGTAAETLDRVESLPLTCLDSLWRVEAGSSVTPAMGAALGLALRDRGDDTGISPNLMDEVHARAKAPLRPFLLRAATPVVATLLLAATLWLFNLEQGVELAGLRGELDATRPSVLEGRRLSQQLRDGATEVQHLGGLVKQTPDRPVGPIVRRLGQCLPEDVWLKVLRLDDGDRVSLAGASYTESGVYDFVRHLEEAPDFQEVALRGTGVEQTPKGPATSFDLDLEMAPAAPAPPEAKRG